MRKSIDIIVLKDYYTNAALKRIADIIISNYNNVSELLAKLEVEASRNNTYLIVKECGDTTFIIL